VPLTYRFIVLQQLRKFIRRGEERVLRALAALLLPSRGNALLPVLVLVLVVVVVVIGKEIRLIQFIEASHGFLFLVSFRFRACPRSRPNETRAPRQPNNHN
jgi:hypothetical protein